MARFRDRVAIVPGAGAPGGIGAAIARELVAEGGRVVLGATSERVHQRAAELGDSAVGGHGPEFCDERREHHRVYTRRRVEFGPSPVLERRSR